MRSTPRKYSASQSMQPCVPFFMRGILDLSVVTVMIVLNKQHAFDRMYVDETFHSMKKKAALILTKWKVFIGLLLLLLGSIRVHVHM